MERVKVVVNNEEESKLAQNLFGDIGLIMNRWSAFETPKFVCNYMEGEFSDYKFNDDGLIKIKEVSLGQLRDMVVLKRNSSLDATHIDSNNYDWYVGSDEKHYRHQGDIWVYQPYVDDWDIKPISKTKEYLDSNYELISNSKELPLWERLIEIPEGAEFLTKCKDHEEKEWLIFWRGKQKLCVGFDEYWFDVDYDGEEYLEHWEGMASIVWYRNLQEEDHKKVDHSELFDKIRSGEVDLKIDKPNVEDTLQERAKTYGSFTSVANTTGQLMTVILNSKNGQTLPYAHQESLHMICSKIARIVNGDPNYKDNWHDIGGYARLIENLIGEIDNGS